MIMVAAVLTLGCSLRFIAPGELLITLSHEPFNTIAAADLGQNEK